MFPIPPPDRLFPRRTLWSPPGRKGPRTLSEGLLVLAWLPMIVAAPIGAYVGVNQWSSVLAVIAAIAAFCLAVGLMDGSLVVAGGIEAVAYGFVAFVETGGLDSASPAISWIVAVAVATLFLVATWDAYRKTRLEGRR